MLSEQPMTNTEQLVEQLERTAKSGVPCMVFMVGKYTGNGPSVVGALRRRGFRVERVGGSNSTYRAYPQDLS